MGGGIALTAFCFFFFRFLKLLLACAPWVTCDQPMDQTTTTIIQVIIKGATIRQPYIYDVEIYVRRFHMAHTCSLPGRFST